MRLIILALRLLRSEMDEICDKNDDIFATFHFDVHARIFFVYFEREVSLKMGRDVLSFFVV